MTPQLPTNCNLTHPVGTTAPGRPPSPVPGNITVIHGNGYEGLPEEAPFDAIIVTAAPPTIPPALIAQLSDKGKMIIPVGDVHTAQSLNLITKTNEKISVKELLLVRFVPMVNA